MRRTSNTLLQHPRGISLFEVVLALAIFLGAITVITQILRTGSRAAMLAQLESEATLICEQRMNEVVAGVQPLQNANKVPLDGKSGWTWSLTIQEAGIPNLLQLEVLVEHTSQNAVGNVSCSMARFLRNPQIYVDAANAAASTGEGG